MQCEYRDPLSDHVLSGGVPAAVSYTHLDVYKRQEYISQKARKYVKNKKGFCHEAHKPYDTEYALSLIHIWGSCRFYIDGKWLRMTEGNACIVAPEVEQTVFSCADEDIVLNLLIRRSTFAESFWDLSLIHI